MWRFEDRSGTTWEVALGRESWGVLCALFVPRDGGPARQVQLDVDTEQDALAELDGLAGASWQELLDRSQPKG